MILLGSWNFDSPDVVPTQFIDGENKLSSFEALNPTYGFSCLKNTDGKYYFCARGRTSVNRDLYAYRYNPVTNTIEQEFRIVVGVVTWDTHRGASIVHDTDGHLYVCFELLRTPANGLHGSDTLIYKTTVAYDVTTLSLLTTLTGRYSYQTIALSGNNVTVAARGTSNTVNFIRDIYEYYDSTDLAVTFGSPIELFNSQDTNKPVYVQRIHDYNGTHDYLIWSERDNNLSNWLFVALFKRTLNSSTWMNFAETTSKDVVATSSIKRSERTPYLIEATTDDNLIAVNFEGGVVKSDGSIKLIISLGQKTGTVIEGNPETKLIAIKFYTFTAGNWVFNYVQIPPGITYVRANERIFQYINNDEAFDDILFIDKKKNHDVWLFRSTDYFATQVNHKITDGNGNYSMGGFPFNITSVEDYLYILNIPHGNIYADDDETAADWSDLFIIKP